MHHREDLGIELIMPPPSCVTYYVTQEHISYCNQTHSNCTHFSKVMSISATTPVRSVTIGFEAIVLSVYRSSFKGTRIRQESLMIPIPRQNEHRRSSPATSSSSSDTRYRERQLMNPRSHTTIGVYGMSGIERLLKDWTYKMSTRTSHSN